MGTKKGRIYGKGAPQTFGGAVAPNCPPPWIRHWISCSAATMRLNRELSLFSLPIAKMCFLTCSCGLELGAMGELGIVFGVLRSWCATEVRRRQTRAFFSCAIILFIFHVDQWFFSFRYCRRVSLGRIGTNVCKWVKLMKQKICEKPYRFA